MKKITTVTLAIMFLIIGCATSYQAKGLTGGYSDKQVSEDTFYIRFEGNGHTTEDQALAFALLRASELTLEKGYNYFSVIDGKETINVGSREVPGYASTSGHFSGGRYYSSTFYSPPSTSTWNMPQTDILIKCYVSKPNEKMTLFDAAKSRDKIITNYGAK